MLTADRLRELLHYDPVTGIFTWLVDTSRMRAGDRAGGIGTEGYLRIQIDGRKYREHRLAWLYVYGEWPAGDLDHRDLIKTHNWIDNLRPATDPENQANKPKSKRNTSGFKGVFRNPRGRWFATIRVYGEQRYLGSFDAPEIAGAVYAAAAREAYGEFARTD